MENPADRPLEARFVEHLRQLGVGLSPERVLVAVSGGRDSVALLFLLRFHATHLPLSLTVAHLDHAMRPGSAADADWVAGLCAAWELPLLRERLAEAPAGETAAREARRAFLRRAARTAGAALVMMGHHADDQAETVLFRAVRGTGLAGLAGMQARTAGGLVRPLLPFWRTELERFATAHGLRWREDPTNRVADAARNRLRLEVIPRVERDVAAGARRSLVSLAALAREAEDALEGVAARAEAELAREEAGVLVLARDRLRVYDSAIGSRILRNVLRRFGVVLSGPGTRAALQFITDAPSGRELQLAGGIRVRTEYGEARVQRAPEADGAGPEDETLVLSAPGAAGAARLGGRRYQVVSRAGDAADAGAEALWSVALPLAQVRFPLRVRAWAEGDRMRTAGGTKTLKRLFAEHRVPRSLRRRLPVLVDDAGAVLWVAGVPRAPSLTPRVGEEALILTILHA